MKRSLVRSLYTHTDGEISHTKLWSNIAYAVGTYKFIVSPNLDADIWLAYLGIVGGAAMASKFIQMKYGVSNDKQQGSE